MKRPVTTLVEGLGHPEGPDVLPDGRIVMVETYTGKLVAWSAELGLHDYALCGGGPNACVLGSDGAVYLTQNGGTAGAWKAAVMSVPSIQRAWPDGRCETVADKVAGLSLQAPNDLTFGPDGRLYFTDPADYDPDDPGPGRVFAIDPDGTGELLEEVPESFPNGIAVEADGSIVWVDSYGRGVYRRSVRRPVRTDLPAAGWAHSRRPQGRRRGQPVDHRLLGRRRRHRPARRHHHRLPRDRRLPAQLRVPRRCAVHHRPR